MRVSSTFPHKRGCCDYMNITESLRFLYKSGKIDRATMREYTLLAHTVYKEEIPKEDEDDCNVTFYSIFGYNDELLLSFDVYDDPPRVDVQFNV